MMDPISQVLLQIGLGVATSAVYDTAKGYLQTGKGSVDGLAQSLNHTYAALNIENATILARHLVDFFAQHGHITITGTSIVAKDSIWMRSAPGTKFSFGAGSSSKTESTEITAGKGARIVGTGGAQIRQNADGSISFYT